MDLNAYQLMAYQLILDRKIEEPKDFLVKSIGPNREQRRKAVKKNQKTF